MQKKERKSVPITDEMLKEAVEQCVSVVGVLNYLNKKQAGGTQSHYKKE